jgi:MFS family permease
MPESSQPAAVSNPIAVAPALARRNLPVLVICQCIATGGTILVVTVGGIIGVDLAPAPWLATLPVSLMVVGTALAVLPASWLMSRVGRRRGFAAGALGGALGALLAAGALLLENFVLFAVAALVMGAQLAFTQQYRFAAAESVPPAAAGRAISIVLAGALGGALLGPEIATRTAVPLWGVAWLGGFLVVALLSVCASALLLAFAEPARQERAADMEPARPLRALLLTAPFAIAVLAGVVGQGTMTFVMTATPVSMHVVDGHSMTETSSVIRAHVLAMYVPSLVSAALIGWLGTVRLMIVGLLALAGTVVVALQGHAYLHYWWALVLLGVGWNFLFVGGTSMLVASYRPAERFGAQAFNDFAVFGVSALASLLAGSVVVRFGWSAVLWSTLPPLVLMLGALALRRAPAVAPADPLSRASDRATR